MNNIQEKTIAVASGKGGVGKTTTSVNIAVLFAKKGIKTAIIDIDPLSDIYTLLDLQELSNNDNPDIIEIFPNLDLVFPKAKIDKDDKNLVKRFESIKNHLALTYDKIIFDLPAGSDYETNLVFLKYTSNIIIVTNDEPTSHTAAGYYIKQAFETGNNVDYIIWHNKYAGITVSGFNPKDIAGNYNNNVSDEDKFDFSRVNIISEAFIPFDPAMDLLQSNPSLSVNILLRMIERVNFLIEQRIDELSADLLLPGKTSILIKHYLHLNPFIKDIDLSYQKISEYIFSILNSSILSKSKNYNKAIAEGGLSIFTDEQRLSIYGLIKSLQKDSLLNELLRASVQLKLALDEQESIGGFFPKADKNKLKAVDRGISLLLQTLNSERNEHNNYIKTTAALLQFDFAIHKLFLSRTVADIITSFIPYKTNNKGVKIRDRHKQIKMIVESNSSYKKEYLRLIKIIFPIALRQLFTIAKTFNTSALIFKKNGELQKKIYLKLLSTFFHTAFNSGLGIVTGFSFRPASEAFEKYTELLIKEKKS